MNRLFLFHWNQSEALARADLLRALGWTVDFEAEDGARGGAAVLNDPPDVLLIYLDRLSSHGRHTAAYLRTRFSTKTLPFVFVAGEGEGLEKAKAMVPDAIHVDEDALPALLKKLVRKPAAKPAFPSGSTIKKRPKPRPTKRELPKRSKARSQ